MLNGQGCADNVSGSLVRHSNEEAVIKEVIGNIYETNKMLLITVKSGNFARARNFDNILPDVVSPALYNINT